MARLDLRDPANRAAAEPLLAQRLPWPPAVTRELRAVVRRAVAVGVVERAVYDVRDGSDELELAAKLGSRSGSTAARSRSTAGSSRPAPGPTGRASASGPIAAWPAAGAELGS